MAPPARPDRARLSALCVMVALAVAGIAIWMRLPGFDGRAFWIDELWRVNLFLANNPIQIYLQHPDSQTGITSPLYLAIHKALALFTLSPSVLRLTSLLAGIAAVLIAFATLRRSGAGLIVSTLIALVFATNPLFIRYSNELKPYIVEILVHLTCLYCWIGVVAQYESPTRSKLAWFFVVLAIAIVLAPNMVFALPSYVLTVFWAIRKNRSCLPIFAAGLISTAALVIACHLVIWRHGADEGMLQFWAEGFWQQGNQGYATWLTTRFGDMVAATFTLGTGYSPNRKYWLAVLLVMTGMLLLRDPRINRRMLVLAILFFSTFFVTLATLNALGFWPLGALRPNLFAFGLIAMGFGLLFLCFDRIPLVRALYAIGLILALAGLLSTSPQILEQLSPPAEEHDKVWEDFRADGVAGARIAAECARGTPVRVLTTAAMTWARTVHEAQDALNHAPRSALTGSCVRFIPIGDGPDALSAAISATRQESAGHEPVIWVLYSFVGPESANALRNAAARFGNVSTEAAYKNAGYFRIDSRPDGATRISRDSESS